MSNSLTYKQEQFCLNLFKGMTQRNAWINAGYSSNYDLAIVDVRASELAAKGKVKVRLAELREQASSPLVMAETARKERLSEIARAKLTNFVKIEGDALEIDLNGEDNAALQEVSIEEWRGGKDQRVQSRTSKVKLINPIQAIAELNKMDGVYQAIPPGLQDNRVVNIFVVDKETKNLMSQVKERTGKLIEG